MLKLIHQAVGVGREIESEHLSSFLFPVHSPTPGLLSKREGLYCPGLEREVHEPELVGASDCEVGILL